ncbi:MAG: sigma 54-interacting transcriptional regulator [Bdellovibrionota bacterium]|nr:MAG: sigma-54-dependent Fis family transcriptional regulator [Pseudomonadota bacterium]
MKRMKNPTILILDDDGIELTNYFMALRERGYLAIGAQTESDAWGILETNPINMILCDVHLSRDLTKCEGLTFLAEAKKRFPHVALMAMSSDTTIDLADRAKAAGAWTFMSKPESIEEEFFVQIRHGLDVGLMLVKDLEGKASQSRSLKGHPEGIVLTKELRQKIKLSVDNPDAVVIIEGETGTGKEEIVKQIHRQMKSHHEMPLVAVNCAHLKGELVKSTLFGHKKGAFTGAVEASIGAIGRANGGILFLDEFHRLPHDSQEMLLRLLQDGTYYRVGDDKELKSFFRLFIAMPGNIDECALEGTIIPDLRYRLYGIDIRIPPLRERLDQMSDFIDLYFAKLDRPFVLTDSERIALIKKCSEFYWQGNVRQLFGVLNMLVINASAQDGHIKASDLVTQRSMLEPGAKNLKEEKDELITLIQDFNASPGQYEEFHNKFEKMLFTRLIQKFPTIKKLCEALGLPRSTFDSKRRILGMKDD